MESRHSQSCEKSPFPGASTLASNLLLPLSAACRANYGMSYQRAGYAGDRPENGARRMFKKIKKNIDSAPGFMHSGRTHGKHITTKTA